MPPRRAVAGFGLAAFGALAALNLWQGHGYWEYSDGVYAYTGRALNRGWGLYTTIAAAQPPGIFWLGAALLAIDDSVDALRVGLALFDLATAAAVLVAVWRLTGR